MKKILGCLVLFITIITTLGCSADYSTVSASDESTDKYKIAELQEQIEELNNRVDDLTRLVAGESGLRWVELGNSLENLNKDDINTRIDKLEDDLYGWSGVGGIQGDIKDINKSIYDLADHINKLENWDLYK
jgi:hypothetical protein